MESALNEVSKALGSLYGLPGYVLVLISCIVIGYVLRAIKFFPNDGIPLACVLMGALLNIVVADPYAPPQLIRVWLAKNLMIGFIVGFVAWRLHKSVLKKLESKFPFLKDLIADEETKFLTRQDALIAEKQAEVDKQKSDMGLNPSKP